MDILQIAIGFFVCLIGTVIVSKIKFSGYLRIDVTDPKCDHYLIDISRNLDNLSRKKSIILKIDNKWIKPQ